MGGIDRGGGPIGAGVVGMPAALLTLRGVSGGSAGPACAGIAPSGRTCDGGGVLVLTGCTPPTGAGVAGAVLLL